MTFGEILRKSETEHKPIRISLEDGFVLDLVYVIDCTNYDDIELDVPQKLIDQCLTKGRERVCIIDWDEIKNVEIFDE